MQNVVWWQANAVGFECVEQLGTEPTALGS